MKKNSWNQTLVALLVIVPAIGLDTGCDAKTSNAVAKLAPVVAQVAAAALGAGGNGGNAGNSPFPTAP
ncbi:MAG: hypothetical protein HY303_02715 [Candidatus Wallbacteria bacterium]|nr:hypothetical protein [Candidatus Wallbacteria bacterium]